MVRNLLKKPEPPERFEEIAARLLGLIAVVGYAVAVGMLMYIAIKYMLSAAEERADLKKSLVNYLIGAIIIFGASGIFQLIVSFIEQAQ